MTSPKHSIRQQLSGGLLNSEFGRLFWIGITFLLLQIPLIQIGGVVAERIGGRNEAMHSVASSWGGHQILFGPRLVVPIVETIEERKTNGLGQITVSSREITRFAVFLPVTTNVAGTVESQTRHRGIFDVPVYTLHTTISGHFDQANLELLDRGKGRARWEDAYLAFRVSSPTSLQEISALRWGEDKLPFEPAPDGKEASRKDLVVGIDLSKAENEIPFGFDIKIKGSSGLDIVPVGKATIVDIRSNWPDPSFMGDWLPTTHSIDDTGFSARWEIPYLSRSFPQQWLSSSGTEQLELSSLGFRLLSLVDNYRMVERSIKYASLFLVLSFACIWLLDILYFSPVHPIQYFLIGLALAVFCLLLVALSEHLDFFWSYLISATCVLAMAFMYSSAVLKSIRRATLLCCLLIALYSYLYTVLHLENLALLAGTTLIVAALATLMFFTRKIDWFTMGKKNAQQKT